MADPATLFGVDLSAVRDRLRTLEYFNSVDDIQAGSEAIAGDVPFLPPAAFVSIASESYERNRYAAGGHGQRATVNLSVLMCIPSQRADSAQSDEVEQARKVVLALLIGWTPPGAQVPFDAVRWNIRLIADGLIWGEWLFRTTFDMVAAPA